MQTLKLDKCPDATACIDFSLKCTLISENISGQETISMMSDVLSNDSGPESEFDFNDMDKKEE